MRLLPVFTPGRALMWGSILALWGTGAIVASSSRALSIRTARQPPAMQHRRCTTFASLPA
jgi:hypothetical protein